MSGNPWHSARKMRIAIASIEESTRLMGWHKSDRLQPAAWAALMADAIKKSRDGVLTYGEARELAYKHFPWFGWPVQIVRRAWALRIFVWVKPSRTGVAWTPTPEIHDARDRARLQNLIAAIPRETTPLWKRALEQRAKGASQ